MNIVLNDFSQVDVSDLAFVGVTIYCNPSDYPGKYVARIFDTLRPINTLVVKDTLEELRFAIQPITFCMMQMPPQPDDDPNIVETWF